MLISDNIKKLDNIWTTTNVLQYFYLSLNLLFLNRLKYLDYAPLISVDIYALENLTVFSPSNFPYNLIIILITEKKTEFSQIFKGSLT